MGSTLTPEERTDEHHVERHATFLKRIKDGPVDLLFLGDSITRRWAEHQAVYNTYFSEFTAANFGVGMDTVQNLLWRITNGELDGISPKLLVLLIGTNNVPSHPAEEIYDGIANVVRVIHEKLPGTRILLLGLFPRRQDEAFSADFREAILDVNRRLQALEKTGYVRFLNLYNTFLDDKGEPSAELLPDGLHPAEEGFKAFGQRLAPVVKEMMEAAE